jgi:hypothetical protein
VTHHLVSAHHLVSEHHLVCAHFLLSTHHLLSAQLDYALQHRPTPQKQQYGRHPLLSTPQRKHLIDWATFNSLSRDIPMKELPKWLGWNCGEYAVRTAFKKEGYTHGVRRRKPPISAKNQALRLTWAEEHKYWTDEQWDEICWSDESWVQPGYHRRQWCTRKIGPSELFHPDCVQHKWQRRIGWMFWGCISGKYGKGKGLFWEKEWKTITTQSYCEHTVPVIYTYLFHHPGLSFQQDGGSGHNAVATLALLKSWGVVPIFWPRTQWLRHGLFRSSKFVSTIRSQPTICHLCVASIQRIFRNRCFHPDHRARRS